MGALFLRELRLATRAGGGALTGVLFFLAVVATIPFALGPDLNMLARIGPAVLWIGALLASLLGLDRLFQADREDGSLDVLVLSADRHMLALTVFVKCLAHWTASVLPLAIAAPFLGLILNMEASRHRRDGADAARRHAGHRFHRSRGRGGRCLAAARRRPGLGARPAAHHPCADLRRLRELRRRQRTGPFPAALSHSRRTDAVSRRDRPDRGGAGATLFGGLEVSVRPWVRLRGKRPAYIQLSEQRHGR